MKLFRNTIYQIYYRTINTKNRKENARIQHIRDQIFGSEKRLQLLKIINVQTVPKQAKLKK